MGSGDTTKKETGSGTRFGEIAVQLKLTTPEQAKAALRRQQELRPAGTAKPIGQILVEAGALTPREVQRILVAQKRLRAGGTPAGGEGAGVPKVFAHFELLDKLGEGGMGAVFRARDRNLDRLVALKVLSPKLSHNVEFLARFQREVRTAGALNHPNIVTAYGAGEFDGRPYLTMELVDGGSLRDKIRDGRRLPEKEALGYMLAVARALAHAHAAGLVHRDVKPDNILISKDGEVKLTDLGLAKSVQDDERLTATGVALGTPFYMAPEQARGLREIDHRVDLYSLGATFHHILTGKPLFQATKRSELMLHHVKTPAPDVREGAPEVSAGTAAMLKKLLEKKPEDRYSSAQVLVEDLERLTTGAPPKHVAVSRGKRPGGRKGAGRAGGKAGGSGGKSRAAKRAPRGHAAKTRTKSGGGCLVTLLLCAAALSGVLFCSMLFAGWY